ncbi:hypothetical protein BHE74_00007091 [Ensete ventricosum]|nr:hypothetical protein GW17_00028681 [Ensete ventricosum]RWW84306.1 hypothetical protein BHE74_00007091 [Ensete ventricosum]
MLRHFARPTELYLYGAVSWPNTSRHVLLLLRPRETGQGLEASRRHRVPTLDRLRPGMGFSMSYGVTTPILSWSSGGFSSTLRTCMSYASLTYA